MESSSNSLSLFINALNTSLNEVLYLLFANRRLCVNKSISVTGLAIVSKATNFRLRSQIVSGPPLQENMVHIQHFDLERREGVLHGYLQLKMKSVYENAESCTR